MAIGYHYIAIRNSHKPHKGKAGNQGRNRGRRQGDTQTTDECVLRNICRHSLSSMHHFNNHNDYNDEAQ